MDNGNCDWSPFIKESDLAMGSLTLNKLNAQILIFAKIPIPNKSLRPGFVGIDFLGSPAPEIASEGHRIRMSKIGVSIKRIK